MGIVAAFDRVLFFNPANKYVTVSLEQYKAEGES